MQNMSKVLGLWLVIGWMSGCQCCILTEKYADVIDHISDSSPRFDHLYHPTWDLTRIGQPDWCQSPFNRWWCHRGCCQPEIGYPIVVSPRRNAHAAVESGELPPYSSDPETERHTAPPESEFEAGPRIPPAPEAPFPALEAPVDEFDPLRID